jgi:two-component system, NtrC family, response regulator GlrR
MQHPKILLLDCKPHESTGEELERLLTSSHLASSLRREVFAEASQVSFDLSWLADADSCLVFLVLAHQALDQAAILIRSIRAQDPEIPIMAVIDGCNPDETLKVLQEGAADFLIPPIRVDDTLPRVRRLLAQLNRRDNFAQALKERVGLKRLVGTTPVFQAEVRKIPLITRCDNHVLITGETGTGKEMFARAIHYLSPRSDKPFVPVNCGAIPIELVENELFGHERGAFTGANTAHAGLVEEAEGGTLFLDEIDSLPLLAQVKLLRFLQDKEFRRLGSSKPRHADIRTIVASNAVLEDSVQKGRLRQDLYYRLNVVSIALPSLRERTEDIPCLVDHFIKKHSGDLHKEITSVSPAALQKLMLYSWPGNVRELEHTIERAVIFCESSQLSESDILLPPGKIKAVDSFQQAKAKIIEQFEREYIQRLLVSCNGNISRAAQAAKKNRRAFWELMRKHHIDVQNLKPSAP